MVKPSRVFPISRENLWELLTRPKQLSEWFGLEVLGLDLRPGGLILFRSANERFRRARIEVLDPPARFAFRWLPGATGPNEADHGLGDGTVEFLLEERAQGTKLAVIEWTVPEESEPEVGELPSVWIPAPTGEPPPDPPGAPPRIFLDA